MRLILQRVSRARVSVGGEELGAIGRGLLVLAGVERGDGERQLASAAEKVAHLRLFEDASGKMNLDLRAAGGAILLVSQFTLLASLTRGRRPSFERAAPPELARPTLERLAQLWRAAGFEVACGRFGAAMEVELVNDGPVTLVLDLAPDP